MAPNIGPVPDREPIVGTALMSSRWVLWLNGVIAALNELLTGVKTGYGSPNGSVVGTRGDLYRRKDGGAGTTIYKKESGDNTDTGWVGW